MGLSDVVAGNITTVYLAVIVALRVYSFISGQVLGGVCVAVVASALVGFILVVTLIWDLAWKSGKIVRRVRERKRDRCRGGICWHGVAVRFPVDQVQLRIPHNF